MDNKTKELLKYCGIAVGGIAITNLLFWNRYKISNYFKTLRINNNSKKMKIVVKRFKKGDSFTLGKLYINGVFFCYTLEDKDRGLKSTMTESEISSKKVAKETAIPTGKYDLTIDVVSPSYKNKGSNSPYVSIDNKLPRLQNVKGFSGILMHIGNYPKDTEGCILLGNWCNESEGTISDSKTAFWNFYEILQKAKDNGKDITIEIK